MSPGHKRQIMVARVNRGRCPAGEACRPFCLHRRTFGYEAKQPDAWMAKVKAALRRMSREHPELGSMKIARLLKKAGWRVGSRLIPRRRQQLALMVPVKQPKRRRGGISTGLATKATHPHHVWTWDFVPDPTMRGGKLRMLTLLDDSTRPSRCIHVDRKITARKVRSIMSWLIAEHGACGAYPQRQWRGVYREGVASLARL